MSDKRENYLSWDEYFMMNALLISARSKDPHNRVGACIVNSDNKVLSVGYNGLPKGMNDDTFDWASSGEITGIKKDVKDYYVVHAERNAILNYRGSLDDLKGSTLYVTWFPCTECTKEIIQVGIKKVVYLRMYSKKELVDISKIMLNHAGVEVVCYGCPNVAVFPLFAKSDDLIREMSAAVHAGCTDGKLCAIPLLPCGGKEIVKVSPYLAPFQVAVNTLVSDAPAFLADTPAHDFRLKAVVLGINAASQVENAVGHLGLVELAAVDQGGGFYRFARFLPRQTQVRVHEDLHLLVVAPGSVQISRNEFLDDLIPAAER